MADGNYSETGQPRDGAEIVVKEMGPPPKLLNASITMPVNSYEPVVLFRIIKSQNPIDTNFWQYRKRYKAIQGKQTWFIGVDERSIPALKVLGYRPHVGLERIKISVNNHN